MADTKRTLSAILALLADNTTRAISAQDIRDMVVSVMGSRTVTAVTAGTTALTTDHDIVLANATGGAITLNLPAAASNTGKVYTVVKTDASVNTVTLDGSGAETINGAATKVLSSQYAKVSIVCDGTGWIEI